MPMNLLCFAADSMNGEATPGVFDFVSNAWHLGRTDAT